MKSKALNKRLLELSIVYFLMALYFLAEALTAEHLNYSFPFVGYGGTFQYPDLRIGEAKISLYWMSHFVGIFFMEVLCIKRCGLYQIKKWQAAITAILLAVFGYIGAKLMYICEDIDKFRQYGLDWGGVSFFGTVFFMPFALSLMALMFRKNPFDFMDYCTPAGIAMLTCIRTGCFLRGCCHGITIWISERPVTLPSQLLECALDVMLLNIILMFEKEGKYRHLRYSIFMGGYGILRFFVEFTRETPKNVLFLSRSQWFAIICIVIMLVGVHFDRHKHPSKPRKA